MIAKNEFDLLLSVNYVKVTQLWCNSNSTCRATHWMYIPSFKLISQSMLKKSPENTDGRTDGRTDGQTDGHCHGIIRPFFKRAYKFKCPWWWHLQRLRHPLISLKVTTTKLNPNPHPLHMDVIYIVHVYWNLPSRQKMGHVIQQALPGLLYRHPIMLTK